MPLLGLVTPWDYAGRHCCSLFPEALRVQLIATAMALSVPKQRIDLDSNDNNGKNNINVFELLKYVSPRFGWVWFLPDLARIT